MGTPATKKDSVPKVELQPDLPPAASSPGAGARGGHADRASPFDEIYMTAEDDPTRVPWCTGQPCRVMVTWLNMEAPTLVRPGCRAVVVGSGLGDDVAELARRGYDVIGFDISPTAVRWSARRHPNHADRFIVADLFAPPPRLIGRFDLVVEIGNLQALDPVQRFPAAQGIARLAAPRGTVLAVAKARDDDETQLNNSGPPWPLTTGELVDLMQESGLAQHGSLMEHPDPDDSTRHLVRAVFTQA